MVLCVNTTAIAAAAQGEKHMVEADTHRSEIGLPIAASDGNETCVPVDTAPRAVLSINGLDLVTLRLFVAVVEEGSFARTAERENIAVSAVSRRISELENRFGIALLDRRDRRVTATAPGQTVFDHVHVMLDQLHLMLRDIDDLRQGKTGRVRIQTHSSVGSTLLPNIVASFARIHPHIDVRIDEMSSHEIPAGIRTGAAEIGLVTGPIEADDLVLIPWSTDDLIAILPRDHELARKGQLVFSEMLEYPFINMHRHNALLGRFRREAQALGKSMVERAHAASFESVRKLVAAGLGVAIVPAIAAFATHEAEAEQIAIRPLNEVWARRNLMACVRSQEHLLGASRLFLAHLLSYEGEALNKTHRRRRFREGISDERIGAAAQLF